MENKERTLLDSFIDVAPYLNQLVMNDVAVMVSDTEATLFCITGKKIGNPVEKGTKIVPGSAAEAAINSKQKVVRQVGPEVFGFPYIGIGFPVFDKQGELLGAVSVVSSLERQDALLSIANHLTAATQEMNATTTELVSQSTILAAIGEQLGSLDRKLESSVKETNGLLRTIKNVTTQSNLLGFNASIEAARAGEAGKGFGVVAGEIRRLAENSAQFLKEIETILESLNKSKVNLGQEINNIGSISANQAASANHLLASAQDISTMSQKLLQYAEDLMK